MQFRNPKHEIRNKFELPKGAITKTGKDVAAFLILLVPKACPPGWVALGNGEPLWQLHCLFC
jgi:hypothetical protein